MLFTALSYMTMARAYPVAGSVYAYAARGIADSVVGSNAGLVCVRHADHLIWAHIGGFAVL